VTAPIALIRADRAVLDRPYNAVVLETYVNVGQGYGQFKGSAFFGARRVAAAPYCVGGGFVIVVQSHSKP
jgi:hypothetical protein